MGEVLAASTYPMEIAEAQQWVLDHPKWKPSKMMDEAKKQNWDPSVQGLVAFPQVLAYLSQDMGWTTQLGNAFLAQQPDVMQAVQRMRALSASAQRFAEAQTEAQGLLRESMSELVNHMVERLDASENGKPKVFKKSTVANLGDFLATFDFRNIANDTELKEQVEKTRALLSGVTAEEIRTTADLRSRLKTGMSEIAAKLDAMVVTMPRRKFRLDE